MSNSKITAKFLERTAYLDAFSGAKGYLSCSAIKMVEKPDNSNILEFLGKITDTKKRLEINSEGTIILKAVYDLLLQFLGKVKIKELKSNISSESAMPDESFEELYDRLQELIGLEKVKSIVNDLISYHKVQKLRENYGLKIPNRTLHLAFLGNPGTGKTTVARIIGKMYKQLGLLSKGTFTEVSRTDLIAGYQGQKALKVKDVIDKAKGGVLFIDEAYSLTENDHSDSYGRECLTELTKALEDYREDLVVIVAGYSNLMHSFFESNPGLKSRFNTFIEFENYNVNELVNIFLRMCNADDYVLKENVKERLALIIKQEITSESEIFANGRYVRNLYEDVIMNHARRISQVVNPSEDNLKELLEKDLPSKDSINYEGFNQ